MSYRLAGKRTKLIFAAGERVGSVVGRTANLLAASPSANGVLQLLQARMNRHLSELCASGLDETCSTRVTGMIENLFATAREITRTILAASPGTAGRMIGIDGIAEMEEPAGCRIHERALRKVLCSIERFGLLNPLVVRRSGSNFELVKGYVRYEACRRLRQDPVPVLVKGLDDMQALQLALLDILLVNGPAYAEPDYLWALSKFYGTIHERQV